MTNNRFGQLHAPCVLAHYANIDGVVITPSGLMYRVLKQGRGQTPSWDDSVVVRQRILANDTQLLPERFTRTLAVEYEIAEAIEGLQEVLQLMPQGSHYEVMIPPSLNQDIFNQASTATTGLVYMDIQLLDIKKPA